MMNYAKKTNVRKCWTWFFIGVIQLIYSILELKGVVSFLSKFVSDTFYPILVWFYLISSILAIVLAILCMIYLQKKHGKI